MHTRHGNVVLRNKRCSHQRGWLDGWMAGWLDGWMAGWLDGWMGGGWPFRESGERDTEIMEGRRMKDLSRVRISSCTIEASSQVCLN